MKDKSVFAQLVSVLFHPVLWVFYILFVLTLLYRSIFVEVKSVVVFLSVSFFLSVVLPSVMIWVLLRFKMVSTLQLAERRERVLPLLVVGVSYFLIHQLFKSMMLPSAFQLLFLGGTCMVLIGMVITMFWKISLHMLSIGATIGFLMAIGLRYGWLLSPIVFIVFFVSGIVGYARLQLQAHTPSQVYVGFGVGWLLLFSLFLFF